MSCRLWSDYKRTYETCPVAAGVFGIASLELVGTTVTYSSPATGNQETSNFPPLHPVPEEAHSQLEGGIINWSSYVEADPDHTNPTTLQNVTHAVTSTFGFESIQPDPFTFRVRVAGRSPGDLTGHDYVNRFNTETLPHQFVVGEDYFDVVISDTAHLNCFTWPAPVIRLYFGGDEVAIQILTPWCD